MNPEITIVNNNNNNNTYYYSNRNNRYIGKTIINYYKL